MLLQLLVNLVNFASLLAVNWLNVLEIIVGLRVLFSPLGFAGGLPTRPFVATGIRILFLLIMTIVINVLLI